MRLKPEFINRLDHYAISYPLSRAEMLKVIELEISKLQERLAPKQVTITLDKKAKDFLVEKGYQPELKERALRRSVEQHLEDPLAELLIRNPDKGRRISITLKKDALDFVDDELFAI